MPVWLCVKASCTHARLVFAADETIPCSSAVIACRDSSHGSDIHVRFTFFVKLTCMSAYVSHRTQTSRWASASSACLDEKETPRGAGRGRPAPRPRPPAVARPPSLRARSLPNRFPRRLPTPRAPQEIVPSFPRSAAMAAERRASERAQGAGLVSEAPWELATPQRLFGVGEWGCVLGARRRRIGPWRERTRCRPCRKRSAALVRDT